MLSLSFVHMSVWMKYHIDENMKCHQTLIKNGILKQIFRGYTLDQNITRGSDVKESSDQSYQKK